MHLPKCLTFDDVFDALVCRRYRVAGVIGINLLRNKLSATNSVRRSKFDGDIGLRLEVAPDPTCLGAHPRRLRCVRGVRHFEEPATAFEG